MASTFSLSDSRQTPARPRFSGLVRQGLLDPVPAPDSAASPEAAVEVLPEDASGADTAHDAHLSVEVAEPASNVH